MNTNRRAFRFGVQMWNLTWRANTVDDWKERARTAEALGYDILLVPDHFGPQFAIGPALAVAAQATSTLRIGTFVWQNDLRHPALIAKEAATLDLLSNGRFEVGIGAGGSFPPEFEWTGIPLDRAGARVHRVEECLHIIKGLAADEAFSFSGDHYTISDYQGSPKPVQQPHPPILVGAGGPRMLSIAAREAGIVGLLPKMRSGGEIDEADASPEGFDRKVALLREVAGDRFLDLEINLLVQAVVITDDREAAFASLETERGMAHPVWRQSPMNLVGSTDEIIETLRAHRERFGISYIVVFEPSMEAFAPIVSALADT